MLLTPVILWSQTDVGVMLVVDLPEVSGVEVGCGEGRFSFFGKSRGKEYGIEFELYGNIEKLHYDVHERNVKIVLDKKEQFLWQSLVKDKNLYKNSIKIDWDNWNDEDDEQESGFDLSQMMRNMDMENFSGDNGDDADEANEPEEHNVPGGECCFRAL